LNFEIQIPLYTQMFVFRKFSVQSQFLADSDVLFQSYVPPISLYNLTGLMS